MPCSKAATSANGLKDDPEVEQKRCVIDIFHIQLDPFFKVCDGVSASDLPKAGEAGIHTKASSVCALFNFFSFIIRQGTRTNDAHFSTEDIDELGEFIKASPSVIRELREGMQIPSLQ
jgi:hypothetical protein